MSDIEQRLVDAKCDAPRLSPKDIDANIKHVEYVKHVSHGGQILRWAVITTTNGFAVTGRPSASVSAENDRQDIGESVALTNAKQELWPLMGYALKEHLFQCTQPAQKPMPSVLRVEVQDDIAEMAYVAAVYWDDSTVTTGRGPTTDKALAAAHKTKEAQNV